LTAVLVLALVMMLALISGVMAGDPTEARTLEEDPRAPYQCDYISNLRALALGRWLAEFGGLHDFSRRRIRCA